MDVVEVVPGLHLLRLGIANAYLWHDQDGATLIDTGPPGSGSAVAAALESLGLRRQDLRRIVLTHFHDDHAGSAAEIASWTGARVVVGRADAAFVRGDVPGPPPAFTAAEQALHAVVAADLEPAPGCRVDEEVEDGHRPLQLNPRLRPGRRPGAGGARPPGRGVRAAAGAGRAR